MRNTFIHTLVLAIFMVSLAGLHSLQAEAGVVKLNMGGRGVSGPYFPTAGTIAKLVNQKHAQHGVRITVQSSRRSVPIVKAVMSGELDLGVARLGHIYQAFRGFAAWDGNPQIELRSVLNVHAEQVALVASVKSGIRTIQDLKNRCVFIGGPTSDLRHTVIDILTASGIDPNSDITIRGKATEEVPGMMQDNEIEAFFYIMGSINREFVDLVSGPQKLSLIPIAGLAVDHMITRNPFYEKSTVEIQHYPYFANETYVQVLGVKAGLITSSRLAENIAYIIVREVFENMNQIKPQYTTTKILTPREMTTDMAAPIHAGAAKFYQQAGIDYKTTMP